jgi:uncharacterized membrane protein YeaQ/YmgE (transglycosylase-associated protein family)
MLFLIVVTWIATGLLIGFIATKLINLRGDDPKLGIGAGAAGAVLAGILHALFGSTGVSSWSWWCLIFAALGATIAVAGWHVVRSRSISHKRYVPRSSY